MLLEVFIITTASVTLLMASYADLKTREVPDWLNYGFLFGVLGIRAIFSLEYGWPVLWSGILGFLICFGLAALFYYTHQWGGGDSKLLMGIGATIGITYPLDNSSLNLFFFFLDLLLIGAIYGIIWMVALAIKKKERFTLAWQDALKKYQFAHLGLGFFAAGILGALFVNLWLFPFLVLMGILFYGFVFVKAVENSCFVKDVSLGKLTEGDWLVKDVVVGKKKIVAAKTLEREDLLKLKKAKVVAVTIKEGIPFVPSFLLAYLLLVFGAGLWTWGLKLFFG